MIFLTINNLKIPKNCNIHMAGGACWSVKKLFSQFYTIHIYYNQTTYPVVCVLITDCSKQSYKEFSNVLKKFEPEQYYD